MKTNKLLAAFVGGVLAVGASAQTSPDGKLSVQVQCEGGAPTYSITYEGKTVLLASPLGLDTNVGDFTKGLTLSKTSEVQKVTTDYTMYNIKRSQNHYEANSQTYTFSSKIKEGRQGRERDVDAMSVTFQVSNNNVAFRYELVAQRRDTKCCVINSEATGFLFPDGTTTFLCPQMGEMTGFARTAPSYETHYDADQPMGKNGWGGGYTFPCLFHEADGWMLVSETGNIDGNYCGCKLENVKDGLYKVAFPSQKENNGYGTNTVQAPLPFATPWRTITFGQTLKPIVETTITWDALSSDSKIRGDRKAIQEKIHGRGAWSWIIANDESCNYDTQKKYIDFASAMGWESLLIDAQWDVQIGRERIAELAAYGKQKGVALYLWYNSNGIWNDAPQTPKNCMDTYHHRRAEMAWMKSIGIRGIKVDFFGGDKQCTMQLYHDILTDAEEFGLFVIFHGCTIPRGWEYAYPNYLASEAVRASENLHFGQGECDRESYSATFLPFIRNAVGNMDFGGSTLNWYYNPFNAEGKGGGHRVTSDVYALATAVLFQTPVQHFAMAPNNLTDAPKWALDFMGKVPTTWTDIKFVDGYPGKYVILARKSIDGKWYLVGVNGQKEAMKVRLSLDLFEAGQTLSFYSDDANNNGGVKPLKVNKKKFVDITIPVNSGFVICE